MAGNNEKYIDWPSAVALGKSGGNELVNIFGNSTTVGTNFRALWEVNADYVFPTEALTMTITSNANDAGYTIKITGLDINYDVISENKVLDDTGTATTANQYYRINDVTVIGGKSGVSFGTPANDISLTNSGVTYAFIKASTGKTKLSAYTVPRGYQYALYRIDAFCATSLQNNREITFRNLSRIHPNNVSIRVADAEFQDRMQILRTIPFVYNQCTDIVFQMKADGGTNTVSVFGEGVLHNLQNQAGIVNSI